MGDITPGYLFVPREGRPGLTSVKLNAAGNGATINPSFVASKPAVSSVTSADQLLVLKSDGTYARVPATVVGGGGGTVGPPGPAGQPAYTLSTTGFTVPAVGSTVTVSVVNTSWVALNEILWIQDAGGPGVAGPMQITAITPTSLTLLNIATSTLGLFTRTVDGLAPHSGGTTGTSNFLREDGNWVAPVSTPVPFDPRGGIYFYDDFSCVGLNTQVWTQASNGGGGATGGTSAYGYDGTRRSNGFIELATGTGTSGTFSKCGGGIVNGFITTATQGMGVVLGSATFDIFARIAIEESTLPVTGVGYTLRFGFVWQNAALTNFPGGDQNGTSCVVLEYSPDQNSGNFRIGYCFQTNAGNTYVNCTGTPVANTYGWWELKITSTGVCTAYFNGVSVGSVTINSNLLGLLLAPYVILWRNNAAATNYHVAVDVLSYNCPYSR